VVSGELLLSFVELWAVCLVCRFEAGRKVRVLVLWFAVVSSGKFRQLLRRIVLDVYNKTFEEGISPRCHVRTGTCPCPSSPLPELSDGTSILCTPTAALVTRGLIGELSEIYFNADVTSSFLNAGIFNSSSGCVCASVFGKSSVLCMCISA